MSLSDNLSPAPPVGSPPPAAPSGSSRPAWLIPVILGVVGCCLVACIVGALVLGPTIGQSANLATMCVVNNPNASQEQCQTWVTNVITNNQAEYTSCEAESGGDPNVTYECLIDSGVTPP